MPEGVAQLHEALGDRYRLQRELGHGPKPFTVDALLDAVGGLVPLPKA